MIYVHSLANAWRARDRLLPPQGRCAAQTGNPAKMSVVIELEVRCAPRYGATVSLSLCLYYCGGGGNGGVVGDVRGSQRGAGGFSWEGVAMVPSCEARGQR